MQNNFEKDVQQKMDGLNLTPSAQVWEKVAIEIAPEKKKRRGIIWFFFAGLLLLGGVRWLLQRVEKATQPVVKIKTLQAGPQVIQTDTTQESIAIEKKTQPAIKNVRTTSPETNSPAGHNANRQDKNVKSATSIVAQAPGGSAAQQNKNLSSSTPVKQTNKASPGETAKKKEPTFKVEQQWPQSSHAQPSITSTPLDTLTAKAAPPTGQIDSAINKNESKKPAPPVVDSVVKKKVASAKGWRSSLTTGIGRSSYTDGSLFKSFNSAQMDAFNAGLGGGAPVVIAPANSSAKPSKISDGFAFSLGYSLAKSLGKKWELTVGLQYAYAFTRQQVGDKKTADTAVQFAADKASANVFYTNTGTTDYANRFHFIELPVSLSFKPSARLPLYILGGASYARLLHTNALTFSSAANLYYQNKENYLRNAVAFFSAVQIQFFAKKKTSLRTGPFVQYNATKLRKENSDGTPHLTVIGLKTSVNF